MSQSRKSKELADATTALLPQLVTFLFTPRFWPAASQLAAVVGTLTVRCPQVPAAKLVPCMLELALPHASGSCSSVDGSSSCGDTPAEQCTCVLLKLLAALAEAAASLEVSMHPRRREEVRASLREAAPAVLPIVLRAMSSRVGDAAMGDCRHAALQLLQVWCTAGGPPAGLQASADLLDRLHAWLVDPELSALAAETLAALYAACEVPASKDQWELLAQLVQRLQPGMDALAAHAAQHPHSNPGRQLLFAAVAVLGAAWRALDSVAAEEAVAEAQRWQEYAADSLLQLIAHPEEEVVAAAVACWDNALERWKAAGAGGTVALVHHQLRAQLLDRLVRALPARMMLQAEVGEAATADGRDLPEAAQAVSACLKMSLPLACSGDWDARSVCELTCTPAPQVRRVCSDTFREAACSAGAYGVAALLLDLAGQAADATPWHLEVLLYSLNLVWSRQAAVQLDSVRHAATLVAATLAPGTPPKLAGTALTLLGGMPAHLLLLDEAMAGEGGHSPLEPLLARLLELLRCDDAKLVRHASTTCWRLCSHGGLAAALATRHAAWAEQLCGVYLAAGGVQQRCGSGDDLSAAEFLLRAACLLCAADGGSNSRQAAERLLQQPVSALGAILGGRRSAFALSEQQCEALALQLVTLAAMLAILAPRDSAAAAHLPAMLEVAWPVLCAAAQAAQHAGGVPLEAACKLTQQLAQVSSHAALQLLAPLCSRLAKPCVLQALKAMVECLPPSCGDGATQIGIVEAVRSAIQLVATQHAEDPDWQRPALDLCGAALCHLPAAVVEPAMLRAQLAVLQQALRSWHRDVCDAALACAAHLCCVGCLPGVLNPGAAELRTELASGLGAVVVLSLLLAASGSMPAFMMSSLASTLHTIWRGVLQDRCVGLTGQLRVQPGHP